MTQPTHSIRVWLMRALFAVLAAVGLGAVGLGSYACGAAIQTWAEHDYLFSGWAMLDWLVGVLGAAMAGAGLIVFGLLLRFMDWEKAPLASLILSIAATVATLGIYAIFSQMPPGLYDINLLVLQAGCLVAMPLVALPPFLHWLNAHRIPKAAAKPLPAPATTPKTAAQPETPAD